MARKFSLMKHYLRAHLWLRHRCERLSEGQRKTIVLGLCLVYLACTCIMIAEFFLSWDDGKDTQKVNEISVPKAKWMDEGIHKQQTIKMTR